MSVAALRLDLDRSRRWTRRSMSASFLLHALLLVWVVTFKSQVSDLPVVTEITLMEPDDFSASLAAAPTAAPASPAKATVSGLANVSRENVQFYRDMPKGDVTPVSESETALTDRMEARLAAMQRSGTARPAGAATSLNAAALIGTGAATIPGGSGSAPVKLVREGAGGAAPLELSRGGTSAAQAVLPPAAIAPGGSSQADAPARAGESTAQRTIAGASLLGPVADRPVLFHSLPVYPDWAKREAVESSVTLYFVVRPNGSVSENIVVQRTAGYGDFDENARTALRAWRFQPLKGGRTGDQWGTITFHFRLREAG